MAVDPKVVGGGAAVVAIGGGSGYAISQAVDSSKDSQDVGSTIGKDTSSTLTPEKKKENKNANKTALTTAGFQVDETKENSNDCKSKLEDGSLSSEDDFKAAVKTCVVGKKFADKAEQMGLNVLKNGTESNWNSEETWWTTNKEVIKKIVSELNSTPSKDTWDSAKTDLINFCTQDSKGNKEINGSLGNDDWTNFLTACTKDKTPTEGAAVTVASIKSKNFWTGK